MTDENINLNLQNEETPPTAEQMESAKSALITFVMYHYQALKAQGYDTPSAKQIVADSILDLYHTYCIVSQTTPSQEINIKNNNTPVQPITILNEIISDVKNIGVSAKPIYNKLIDFKKLVVKEN